MSNVLGGASVINGCVHVIGLDYKWRSLLQKFNMSYESYKKSCVDLYTRRLERKKLALRAARQSTLDHAFTNALNNHGVACGETDVMDFESCGPTINTAGRVFRSSVRDLNSYKSVKINSSSKVTNLIIDKFNNVKGVVVNGQQYFADYVILSAGVIGTNELLLRPKFLHEEKKFVEVKIIDGYGIKDHLNLRINVAASCKIESLNVINKSILRKVLLGLKHFLGFETLMSGTGATSSANIDIDGDGLVDTRINLLNFSENGRLGSSGQIFDKQPGFSLSITPINPSSTGEMMLNDEGKAILRPGYLNNEADRIALRGAVNYCIELLDSEPLNRYISSIESLEKIKMDIDGYIDENIYSGYHLIGGCQNVVDESFNVVGFKGLYICDASVLGEYVSSNIHSTVAILADLFAKKFMENNRIN